MFVDSSDVKAVHRNQTVSPDSWSRWCWRVAILCMVWSSIRCCAWKTYRSWLGIKGAEEAYPHACRRTHTFYRDLRVFPSCENRLSKDASIVLEPLSESAVVKVQENIFGEITVDDSEELFTFRLKGGVAPEAPDKKVISFAARAVQRHRTCCQSDEFSYLDLRSIVPNSNLCEQCFANSGFLLNDSRQGLKPWNLEAQLFLHVNKEFWNFSDVNYVVRTK